VRLLFDTHTFSYMPGTPRSGFWQVPFRSSPLRGEDTGEGDGCGRPLSLSLSHKGERGPEAERCGILTPHLGVPSI
jgi:hypothetical protein